MSSLRSRPAGSFSRALPRHIAVVAATTLLSVAVAAWLGARVPRGHQATAVVQLGVSEAPIATRVDPVLSEIVVLRSRTVIGNAIDREGLRLISSSSEEPAGASREEAIDYVLERLDATPVPSEARIQVAFTSEDSSMAQRTVNAIVLAYQEASGEAARQEARRRMEFLAGELRATDSLIPVARAERDRVLVREAEAASKEEQLVSLRTSEALLSRTLAAPDAARTVDSGVLMSLPAMAGQPDARALYARFLSYRSERETALAARSPQHPDVQRLNTLLAATRQELLSVAGARLRSLQARIAAVEEDVAAETASVPGYAVVAGEPILPASVEALEERASDLQDQYEAARAEAESIQGPVESVQPATGTVPVRPVPWAQMVLGLVTGVLVGSGATVGWDRLRAGRAAVPAIEGAEPTPAAPEPAPAAPEEVAEPAIGAAAAATGTSRKRREAPVPNLAVIPEVRPSLVEPALNGDFRPGPLQLAGIDAYRMLRSNLVSEWWGLKTLVVTSAHPGEGKTTTSTNLAATYARQGIKVVLVECDLRRPSLGRYFGIDREVDLMDVLFEDQDWRKAIQLTKMPGLYVILGEKSFPRAGESLGGPEMKRLLAELSGEYDMVILDTSPLLVSTDAIVLGPLADAVLLVVRSTRTDRRTMVDVVRRLRESGSNVIGTILNDPEGVGAPS
jgi:capsular exopolysaccharide synthesis family protein